MILLPPKPSIRKEYNLTHNHQEYNHPPHRSLILTRKINLNKEGINKDREINRDIEKIEEENLNLLQALLLHHQVVLIREKNREDLVDVDK